jgi:hypothetical protein
MVPCWFKGTISPDMICLEVVWFNTPRLRNVMLDFIKKFYSPFNFVLAVKVLMLPTLNTY